MGPVRGDSPAGPGLLLLFGLVAFVGAYGPWTFPQAFARRNFPFNWTRDDTVPRRGFVVAPFLAMGLFLVVAAIAAL
jgi:hypothetical protein